LRSLLDVSRAIASTLELEPLLELILDQLKIVTDYSGAGILIGDGTAARLAAGRGASRAEREREAIGLLLPLDRGGKLWATLRDRRSVIIEDAESEEPLARDYRAWIGEEISKPAFQFIRGLLLVPLIANDRVIGGFILASRTPGHYTPHHARLAEAIASQAALAIENARLFEEVQAAAALEERTRLAHDLHDSVTQTVFSLGMLARAAQAQHRQGSERLGETLDRVATLAQEALVEMRSPLFQLRPDTQLEAGLDVALQRLAEAVSGRSGLEVDYDGGAPRLAPATEMAIFRVVQEALANAVKHAEASQIAVMAEARDGLLSVSVRDNGRGFDPDALVSPSPDGRSGGQGLRSMRQRATSAGLTLKIESTPGHGSRVLVSAPLTN
jgi:signal transduction histidine kinase